MADKSHAGESGPAQPNGSILDSLRHNQTGALAAGTVIAVAVGLLLSVLVPSEVNALALVLLGLLVAIAVGASVRYVSRWRALTDMVAAAVLTVVGIHLMTVVGMAQGPLPGIEGIAEGPTVSFNDALVLALATPALGTGPILAGIVAAIIVGWGRPRR